ncbi:MAG: hypothetical protein IJB89_04870 [Akkermansia sp.]|nr:hypothetical protein [Akkermansia sp.]
MKTIYSLILPCLLMSAASATGLTLSSSFETQSDPTPLAAHRLSDEQFDREMRIRIASVCHPTANKNSWDGLMWLINNHPQQSYQWMNKMHRQYPQDLLIKSLLAEMYYVGHGTQMNLEKGINMAREAARLGSRRAQYFLRSRGLGY